jgi:Fic family protein
VDTAQASNPPTPVGHHERRFWPADPSAPAWGRRGGPYEVFIPDRIANRDFTFGGEAVTAIADAAKALGRLSEENPRIASVAALGRNLLRSESTASSRIEGVQISNRRLARATYMHENGHHVDRRAVEVLGNVQAMERAIELGTIATPIGVADIQDIHRTLLRFTDDRQIAGVLRTKQSWVGGNDHHPIGAPYVAPPHEHVEPLLEDLCEFMARTDIAPVAQAAISHAQFENIHPFQDGNGRAGRALIYTILRRRGDIAACVPPISLVLGAEPRNYVSGLGAYSQGRVDTWCGQFASATARAAREAGHLAQTIEDHEASWLAQLGEPRSDATVRLLLAGLPGQPVIDVNAAQRLTGRSHVAVGRALQQLQDAGVLRKLNERKWGRVWECEDLLRLIDVFEKRMSTP